MNRRYGGGKLSLNELPHEDINPMDGAANLADVMLVLACGLMLALIINWNVDIGGASSKATQVSQGQEVTGVQGFTDDGDDFEDDSAQYERMGVVYKDPSSGKMYLVTGDD